MENSYEVFFNQFIVKLNTTWTETHEQCVSASLLINSLSPIVAKMSEQLELMQMISEKKSSLKRRYLSMPTKEKIKLLLQIVTIIFCVCGLLVYTSMLCDQYFKGRTVVSIRFETLKVNHKIPAFTVCYPELVSMQKTTEYYPNPKLRKVFQNYLRLVSTADENQYRNENFTEKLNKLYYEKFNNMIKEDESITIRDLFELSMPFEAIQLDPIYPDNVGKPLIEVKILGNHHFKNGTSELRDIEDLHPIETIVLKEMSDHKCFTFFSHLNKTWRNLHMDLIEVSITIRHDIRHFPANRLSEQNLDFAMHSPNTIPLFLGVNNFRSVKANHFIEMTYSRWKTVLLKSPYKTNCKNYEMDDKQEFKFRSDCINHCIHHKINDCVKQKALLHNFVHKECVSRTEALWTRQIFAKHFSVQPCFAHFSPKHNKYDEFSERECLVKKTDQFEAQCANQCQPECKNRYYRYDIKNERPMSTGSTEIKIVHDQFPDQLTEHMPETTGIAFVANFGGLMGMWLGLSVLAILKFFLKTIFNRIHSSQ